MPQIQLEHRTRLSASEIKEKASGLIQEALKSFEDKVSEVSQEWRGNQLIFSFKAMGFRVSGEAFVYDGCVAINAKIPLAASVFKRKIEVMLGEKAGELFPA